MHCTSSRLAAGALALAVLSLNFARAQEPRDVGIAGKVVSVDQGVVNMKSDNDTPYIVQVPAEGARVEVSGTGTLDFLRAGQYVTFKAELDKRGKGLSDVTELAVFTPKQELELGISNDDPASKTGPFTVGGQVRTAKKGRLTVSAAGKSVQIKLAEGAKIEFVLSDYSLAQEGDEINFVGKLVQEGNKNQAGVVVVEEMFIKVAEPAGAPGKKKPRPKKSVPSKEKPPKEKPETKAEPSG